jgi:hypothetical protein
MKTEKTDAKAQAHMKPPETDKNFVLQSCSDLAEAGFGFLHESSDSVRHLYLISGQVYRIGESDLTRIR